MYRRRERPNLPSEKKIREYWQSTDIWLKKPTQFCSSSELLEKDVCFACGFMHNPRKKKSTKSCERAHILARSEGGSDTVENLHMLCRYCHLDSEMISGEKYWDWFYRRSILDIAGSLALRSGLISFSEVIDLTNINPT